MRRRCPDDELRRVVDDDVPDRVARHRREQHADGLLAHAHVGHPDRRQGRRGVGRERVVVEGHQRGVTRHHDAVRGQLRQDTDRTHEAGHEVSRRAIMVGRREDLPQRLAAAVLRFAVVA